MTESGGVELADIELTWTQVFPNHPAGPSEKYLSANKWTSPVTYFVGRNGSGKTRTARCIASLFGTECRLLATDRLLALTAVTNWSWTMKPDPESYRGVPSGGNSNHDQFVRQETKSAGMGIDEIYTLREQPDVALEVAAFIRRVFGRTIDIRESGGFIDPFVRINDLEYSLFRDEGHGLRELIILLSATYRNDWKILVVDEPELHLHPAAVRVWQSEIERICTETHRQAIVVTHEPALIRANNCSDLSKIVIFSAGRAPAQVSEHVMTEQTGRVNASLKRNPTLVSQLAFSPRPVLVEGIHDVAAIGTALTRIGDAHAVSQTDLIECGGSAGVALWFEIGQKLGVNLRAVADLDALFSAECPRVMDTVPAIIDAYQQQFGAEPASTKTILKPLQERMSRENVAADPASKRKWLASLSNDGHAHERNKLLVLWRKHGLWLHECGRLEDVLNLPEKASVELATTAAESAGEIDKVAQWCIYAVDTNATLYRLLEAAVESIAHRILEALRVDPGKKFEMPVGSNATNDARMVDVKPLENGKHRITVKLPSQFAGHWIDFDRATSPNELVLKSPDETLE